MVGVDGSDCGEIALIWAGRRAEYRGATLAVVTTWTVLPQPIVHPYASFHDRDRGEAAMSTLGGTVPSGADTRGHIVWFRP